MKAVFRELVAKGLIYGLGSSLNGLIGFVLIPYFLRQLRADEYGRFAIAEMVLNLLLIPLSLGLNVSVLARYPRIAPEDRRAFLGELFAFLVVSTLVLEGLFLGVLTLSGERLIPGMDARTRLLVAGISALETLWLLVATVFRAEGWAWRFIGASILQVTVGLVATIVLISYLGFRGEGILVGRLIGAAAVCAVVVVPEALRCAHRWRFEAVRPILRIGLPLLPATLANTWVLMSPRYFIEWFGGTADVGTFAMSAKIAGLLSLGFVQPFAMAWMVSLFKVYQRPDATRVYGRVLTYYVLLGGAAACGLGLAAHAFVPLLSQQTFPLSTSIVTVMALATVAAGLMYPVNIGPYVLERTAVMTPVFVLSGVLVTAFGAALTKVFGAVGGAAALLLVFLIQAVVLMRLSQRLYPIVIESRRLAKVVVALAVGFAAAQGFRGWMATEAAAWAALPLFVVAATAMLTITGFPERAELTALRSLAGRLRLWRAA